MKLLNLSTIGAAIGVTTTKPVTLPAPPTSLAVQANFTYDSGGTSVDAYLQTSLDLGATWIDIAQFHFTTTSARFVYNLSAETPVTAEYTPTDGTLSANTAKDGILGPMFQVKYKSTGTYGGASALSIDIAGDQTGRL